MNFPRKTYEIRNFVSLSPSDRSWMAPNIICWHKIRQPEDPQILYKKAFIITYDPDKNRAKIKISESSGSQFLDCKTLPSLIFDVDAHSLYPAMPAFIPQGYENMVKMGVINEPEILGNFQNRFNKNMVYTYIDDILFYLDRAALRASVLAKSNELFFGKAMKKTAVSSLKDFPPHLFSMIVNAIHQGFENKKGQAIIAMGVSGSGKSLNVNKAIEFIASLNNEKMEDFEFMMTKSNTFFDVIEEKFNACNTILNLFGACRTKVHSNSSRFFKFFQVILNKKKRKTEAGILDCHFLEKKRVSRKENVVSMESNFKIFYSLFHDFPENIMRTLGLLSTNNEKLSISDFRILMTSPQPIFQAEEEVSSRLLCQFKILGFREEEILTIFRILSIILMLSERQNPLFRPKFSDLFDVDRESCDSFLDALTDASVADLCSEIYCQLFKSIVKKINVNLMNEPRKTAEISTLLEFKDVFQTQIFSNSHPKYTCLCFVDMLGFEFQESGDENNGYGIDQLVNNYLNEKLQQYFIENVFKSEEVEFLQEGLLSESPNVFFNDNLSIIQIFESKNNENLENSLMDLRDKGERLFEEEKGRFLDKLEKIVLRDKTNAIFVNKPGESFMIFHSPGEVEYKYRNFKRFSEKIPDLYDTFEEEILLSSKNPVFSHFLSKKPPPKNAFPFNSASEEFNSLIKSLSSFEKHYFLCVSPMKSREITENTPKNFFDALYIAQQLRSFNCENLLSFKKQGFLVKKTYKQFYQDYSNLANITINLKYREQTMDYRRMVEFIIESVIPEFYLQKKKVLFGKNRIFLNADAALALDNKLMTLWKKQNEKAILIQKNYHCFKFRNNLKMGVKGLKVFLKVIIKLQAKKKSNKQRNIFVSKKKSIGMILSLGKTLQKKAAFNRFYRIIKDMNLKKKNVHFQEKSGPEKTLKEFHSTLSVKTIPSRDPEERKTRIKKEAITTEREHSVLKEKERKKTIQIKNHKLKRQTSKSTDYLKNVGNSIFARFMDDTDGGVSTFTAKRRKCISAKSLIDYENKSRNTPFEEFLEISARKKFVPKEIRDFPASPDIRFNFESLELSIKQEIEKNDFEIELLKRFPKKFQKMSFQNKALESPILEFPKKYHETCKKCFKYILQYSGDRKNKFTSFQQLTKLLKIALENEHDSIRDEVYLQIVKQTNKNPSPVSLSNLNKLLAIVASFIAPSQKFYFLLLNFLMQKAKMNPEMCDFARFTFVRMMKSKERPIRKNLPLMNEVTCIELNRMILIPIYLLSGEHVLISFESYTLVDELLDDLVKRLKISSRKKNLGLFIQSKASKNNEIVFEEISLAEQSNMLDCLAGFDKKIRENESTQISFKVVLKIKLFFDLDPKSNDDVTLFYIQMVHDFLQGRFLLQEDDVMNLASCKMAVDHGDFSAEKVRFLKINIEDYIPVDFLEMHKPQNWIDRILITYLQMKTYSKVLGKKKFLESLRKFKMFASHQFFVIYSVLKLGLVVKMGVLENVQELSPQQNKLLVITMKNIQICEGKGIVSAMVDMKKVMNVTGSEGNNEVLIEEEDKKHIISCDKWKEIEQIVRFYKEKSLIDDN